MLLVLSLIFCVTAGLYASVGFGGGSTYNAVLVLSGIDYQILPAVALICNVIVVTGGTIRFWNSGQLQIKAMAPFLITSVPAAWFGGRLIVTETMFVGLLGAALLLSGLRLGTQKEVVIANGERRRRDWNPAYIVAGASIGFLSGLVGIGGGIFLAPILYYFSWDTPKKIAAACSLFILANSVSGLLGQASKLSQTGALEEIWTYWPLMLSVFIGGQIGSWAASQKLQPRLIKQLTAALILFVSLRLLLRWASMMGYY